MRILLVSDYSTPDGGAELHVAQLRSAFRARGHEARLFASAAGAPDLRSADHECFGSRSRVPNRLLQTHNPLAARALRRVLRSFQPDVVHLHMFLTQLSPSLLRHLESIPTVYTAHTYRAVCPTGLKLLPEGTVCTERSGAPCLANACLPFPLWAIDMMQKALLQRRVSAIDVVLANSEFVSGQLRAGGFEARHCPLWMKLPDPLPWPDSSSEVAYVGRLRREKGVRILLRAFRRTVTQRPQARLTIAGDGPDRPDLEALVRRLDLSAAVDFRGHVAGEELSAIYRRAAVVAVPSLWPEPLGLVALEAGAVGRPVVASKIGGLQESVLDQRTGFLVPPGDTERLAQSLSELLEDEDLARTMGAAAANHVDSLVDEEERLQALLSAYEEAIRNVNSKCRGGHG